jgi:hypothetical protein
MSRYKDRYNLILDDTAWPHHGKGDALWRTALASIAYPDDEELDMAVQFNLMKLQRYPGMSDDFSRDQAIMASVAMYLNHRFVFNLPKRLSKKFKQTPDMRWWLKALRKGKEGRGFLLWHIIVTGWFMLPLQSLYRRVFNNDESGPFPTFALHLLSWMVYCLPDSKLKFKLNWKLLHYVEPGNILLEKLNRLYIPEGKLKATPMSDFQWQRRYSHPARGIILIETPDCPYPIDVDILKVI